MYLNIKITSNQYHREFKAEAINWSSKAESFWYFKEDGEIGHKIFQVPAVVVKHGSGKIEVIPLDKDYHTVEVMEIGEQQEKVSKLRKIQQAIRGYFGKRQAVL